MYPILWEHDYVDFLCLLFLVEFSDCGDHTRQFQNLQNPQFLINLHPKKADPKNRRRDPKATPRISLKPMNPILWEHADVDFRGLLFLVEFSDCCNQIEGLNFLCSFPSVRRHVERLRVDGFEENVWVRKDPKQAQMDVLITGRLCVDGFEEKVWVQTGPKQAQMDVLITGRLCVDSFEEKVWVQTGPRLIWGRSWSATVDATRPQ